VVLKAAHTTSDAELAAVLETNLGTSFSVLRASVKAMTRSGAPGGSVVLCSSAVARFGLPNHEAIAAAKGAVAALALSAAATYAPQNVRVNVVSPGLVRVCEPLLLGAHPCAAVHSSRACSPRRRARP
jgi:NAD(P)-dependent dehydrogenase (short-subunit alcohol dehydrogenase family)